MKKSYEANVVTERLGRVYDSVEFNLANGQTDYDIKTNQATSFLNCDLYTTISIRTNYNITVKFNATTQPSITVTPARPLSMDNMIEITNIFISNSSGSTAAIKIIGVKKGL